MKPPQIMVIPLFVLLLVAGCIKSESSNTNLDNRTQDMTKIKENTKTPSITITPQNNDKTLPLIIAHRGARSLSPENTIAAAKKALEIGADLWELDVAVTSDNELVVLHDDTLDRTCDVKDKYPGKVPWRVWEFTLEELKTLDCGTWFINTDPFGQIKKGNVSEEELESYRGEKMPTLSEALTFTHENHWRVNIELKDQFLDQYDSVIVERTVALIEELGMDDGIQVVISSFNHEYLRMVKELNPNIPIQMLTSVKINNLSEYLKLYGTDSCNPKIDVWSKQDLEQLGKEGIKFNIWTVNDPATMNELIDIHVAGIFTDYPQLLKGILYP